MKQKIFALCFYPTLRFLYINKLILLIFVRIVCGNFYKNDACQTKLMPGLCKTWSECFIMKSLIEKGEYTKGEVKHCGYDTNEEIICCPLLNMEFQMEHNMNMPSPHHFDNLSLDVPTQKKISPMIIDQLNRPAIRACQKFESGLSPALTPHILGGVPAELGEFPHMAAIGYARIGDDRPPYEIRCGGTLISSLYVLTAAHCVARRDNVPVIVRLGIVNFTDPIEIRLAVEIKIKEIVIHDNYTIRSTYNDIALLKLEREVIFNNFVYPTCLYTEENDPPPNANLYVIGWGTVNTTTRAFSDILLKASLEITPLEYCNETYKNYGLPRQLSEGILKTQLCAADKLRGKDSCQGDSGGPLNLVIDESYRKYRIVGIVSTGFGCASTTPGLYTRVAYFLNFIESVVWPNGIV